MPTEQVRWWIEETWAELHSHLAPARTGRHHLQWGRSANWQRHLFTTKGPSQGWVFQESASICLYLVSLRSCTCEYLNLALLVCERTGASSFEETWKHGFSVRNKVLCCPPLVLGQPFPLAWAREQHLTASLPLSVPVQSQPYPWPWFWGWAQALTMLCVVVDDFQYL